jgi:hypothetical protein
MNARHILALALLAGSAAAQANVTIFSDNFDANALNLNAVPTGWTVTAGTVDIIGNPGFFDMLPGSGRYIDLDGSTSNSGVLSKSFSLLAGTTYTASFDLAGNHRNSAVESVAVNFGTASTSASLAQNAGWTGYSLSFTTTAAGSYTLSFENSGGDNIGMLLDNVKVDQHVAAIPEPQTYALMGMGLLAIGFAARRRMPR